MGAGRPLPKLELTVEENNRLVEWARRRTTAQALTLRARIVLGCAQGSTNSQVAQRLRVTVQTVDNAVRTFAPTGEHVRTDLSAPLFVSDPDDYGGGELRLRDTYGTHSVKLPAGDLILYPASSLHRVEPVTRGARIAAFFWIQSMIRDVERRRLLFEMDMAILQLRPTQGETEPVVSLVACYRNLMRMGVEL